MTAFDSKIAAAVAIAIALIYMVISLATGHSARADFPPDLSPDSSQLGIGVWQAADLMVKESARIQVIDVRSPLEFARYHIPGSQNKPGADPGVIAALAKAGPVIVACATDDQVSKNVAAARAATGSKKIFFLTGGVKSWYLAFALPVPLFSDKKVPFGYEKALAVVNGHFLDPQGSDKKQVTEALGILARLEYEPNLLKKSGKPKAAGKKRKKIAGGCG